MAAPRITRLSPAHQSANVSLNPTLRIEWDVALDVATITADKFFLTRVEDHVSIGVTSLLLENDVITCSPASALTPDASYTITVSAGIRSILGGTTTAATTWAFSTGEGTRIAAPVLSSPSTDAHVSTLECTWGAVSGAVTYVLELCPLRTFSGADLITYTGITATTFEPETSPDDGAYFIRVCAIDANNAASAWSTVINVAYNTYVDRDTVEVGFGALWSVPAQSFEVVRMSPPSGSANLPVTRVAIYFTEALNEDTLTEDDEAYAVPSWRVSPLIGANFTQPTGTWSLSESGLILSFTGTFAQNTTYEVVLDPNTQTVDGATLIDIPRLWFTTDLSVLYCTPGQIRAILGGLVSDYDDALLWVHAFRASVAVTANINGASLIYTNSLTPIDALLVTARVVEEALLRAKLSLLQYRLTELENSGNVAKRLGDFSYDYERNDFAGITALINQTQMLVNSMAGGGATPIRAESMGRVADGPQPTVRNSF